MILKREYGKKILELETACKDAMKELDCLLSKSLPMNYSQVHDGNLEKRLEVASKKIVALEKKIAKLEAYIQELNSILQLVNKQTDLIGIIRNKDWELS